MAINKLNLQIGGSDNSHHKEVEKLEESIDISIDQLLAEEFGEELEFIDPEAPVEEEQPAPQQIFMEDFGIESPHIEARHTIPAPEPERQKTGVDIMAESMSAYHKKIDYAHKDAELPSDGDRIKLLEDAFAQMKRAQPNTLVSGIGASLDSGGGSVWLWDLEDVEIGAPLNGQYPDVTDGAFISYNASKQRWEAVEESGAANILSGGVIKSTGGSANTSGDLVIESTDATNGNLTFQYQQQAGPVETIVFDGNSGNTTFKGGHVVIERRIGSTIGASTFTIQGRVTDAPNDPVGILFSTYNSHPMDNGTADSIRYAGRVNNNKDIATKEYVDSKIVDPGGSFVFKGTCNVTLSPAANTPAVEQGVGYFYINTVAGTAVAAWPGIGDNGGLSISADQLIIWSESESRWFAGAVENDTTFLKVDGSNQMSGQLVVNIANDASSNSAINIKQGGNTNAQIFSGGSATFKAVTCQNISSFNVKPQTDDTYVLGDSTKSWQSAHINAINSVGITNTANLDVAGFVTLANTGTSAITFGNDNAVGYTNIPSYLFSGGKSATTVFKRCSDNSMNNPQWTIEGKTTAGDGVKTNKLLSVTRMSGTQSDYITYLGRTSNGTDLQTLDSVNSTNHTFTGTNTFNAGFTVGFANNLNAIFNRGLRIIENTSDTTKNGLLQFRVANNGADNNSNYILFQGSGQNDGTNPGEYIFARDTDVDNVVDSDIYFKLVAPRGTTAGVKTIFSQPVQGPTPTQNADLATKEYVDAAAGEITKDWTNLLGNGPSDPPWSTQHRQYRIRGKMVDIRIDYAAAGTSVAFNANAFLNFGNVGSEAIPITMASATAICNPSGTVTPYSNPYLITVDEFGHVYVYSNGQGSIQRVKAFFSYPLFT